MTDPACHQSIVRRTVRAVMTSKRKKIANRRNARRSTGPVTAQGRARSASNAVTHGLGVRHVHDAETEKRIETLAAELAGDAPDPIVAQLAREAADAQIYVERVREARLWAWHTATHDKTIRAREQLDEEEMAENIMILRREGYPLHIIRKMSPECFMEPFRSDEERDIAVIGHATRQLIRLLRYERAAVNRRDKALRALEARGDEAATTDGRNLDPSPGSAGDNAD